MSADSSDAGGPEPERAQQQDPTAAAGAAANAAASQLVDQPPAASTRRAAANRAAQPHAVTAEAPAAVASESQQPQEQQQQQHQQQQQEVYPMPEATHEQVVQDAELFHATLKRLHQTLGITEKVPRVGGRELDLHLLYKAVTRLDGCESVTSHKRWRDAASDFHFPETITSVSYVLRKAYITFLWDYEQVYYFRYVGPRLPAPITHRSEMVDDPTALSKPALGNKRKRKHLPLPPGSAVPLTAPAAVPVGASGVAEAAPPQLQLVAHSTASGQPDPGLVGAVGEVYVDSSFDAGYFCTVTLGRQAFRGMLYFPPSEQGAVRPQPQQLLSLAPSGAAIAVPQLQQSAMAPSHQVVFLTAEQQAQRNPRMRDPDAPKPNKTPFNYFSVDARVRAKAAHPDLSHTDITKKVGEMWQQATPEERAPFVALCEADKARYLAELEEYRRRKQAQRDAAAAAAAAAAPVASQPYQPGGYVSSTYSSLMHHLPSGPVAAATAVVAAQQQQQQQGQVLSQAPNHSQPMGLALQLGPSSSASLGAAPAAPSAASTQQPRPPAASRAAGGAPASISLPVPAIDD